MPLSIDQRMECLRQAIAATPLCTSSITLVRCASEFAAFVEGLPTAKLTQLEAEVAELNLPAPKGKKKPTGVLTGSDQAAIKLGGSKESRTAAPAEAPKDFAAVQQAALALRDKVSKEAVREALNKYGAKTIQELTDIQWSAYVAYCEATIANAVGPADDDFGV